MWLNPEIAEAAPTAPAITAKNTKKPVAKFPIGKNIGLKCAGNTSSGPIIPKQYVKHKA